MDLKEEIEKVTKVKPEEQKLIGISQPRASAPLDTVCYFSYIILFFILIFIAHFLLLSIP